MPRPRTGGVLGHPLGTEPLLSVVQRLSFAKSLDEVTAVIRTAARLLTAADGATFVLRQGGHCYYAAEEAIGPLWKGLRFPLDQCISGWVMTQGIPAAIPDIFVDPRIPQEAYRPTFVKSLLMVPVRPPDAQAAIGLYWASHHAATADELAITTALADTAAPAAALTAYRGADHRGRAESAGYRLFLEKPIAVDELTEKLAELALEGPVAST